MKSMMRQLVERTETAGEEEWIWRCLAIPAGQDTEEAAGGSNERMEVSTQDREAELQNNPVRMEASENPPEKGFQRL